MDWARDDAYLSSERDLRLFSYQPRRAIVIKIVSSNSFKPQKWCLETDEDWTVWLDTQINPLDSGLVLILSGETATQAITNTFEGEPLQSNPLYDALKTDQLCREALANLGEKEVPETPSCPIGFTGTQRGRSLRQLPVSKPTFQKLCEALKVHRSIVPAIARSDVPSFACERVHMGRPSLDVVYTCRSSNAWPNDAALSVTYYPQNNMSFAVLYGSNPSAEASILNRLQHVSTEARHPLLLPGMFAEIELERHKIYTEAGISDLEAKILELNVKLDCSSKAEVERKNIEKRTAWLDMSYLRDSIMTWKVQLERMSEHNDALARDPAIKTSSVTDLDAPHAILCETTTKIKTRLTTMCDEYDEKIRDCTMRLDGMAIATQWAQNEAAADIALATSQDAKIMKSISLVTMIFLPGTFFATVFSINFVDWNNDDGNVKVSSYVWIYIVVTIFFTAITIGLWYFFVLHRRQPAIAVDEEVVASGMIQPLTDSRKNGLRTTNIGAQIKSRFC